MNDTGLVMPMALQAGLSEYAHNQLAIAPEFGPRLRFSKIFKNMPLKLGAPKRLSVAKFCDICTKCADACLVKALPFGPSTVGGGTSSIQAVKKWTSDAEKCFSFSAKLSSWWEQCCVCFFRKLLYLNHLTIKDYIMSLRPNLETRQATPAIEGAGVKLHRAFGFQDPSEMDPFLLFDDFRNELSEDFEKGFPWHPHRGIETITYVLTGTVEHGDSLGNKGTLGAGDVQWMTAGRGIMHQEMPKGNQNGQMHGFQLWGNLPGSLKMTAPRYQDVTGTEIPEIIDDDGTRVKVIVGKFWGKKGPVDGIAADPQYLDIYVPPGVQKNFKIDTYRRAFAYVFDGAAAFADASTPTGVLLEKEVAGQELNIRDLSGNRTLVRFGTGNEVCLQAGDEGVRFLLISGAPIDEPVAWHGPIVMNTHEELAQAFSELRNGTFIKPSH